MPARKAGSRHVCGNVNSREWRAGQTWRGVPFVLVFSSRIISISTTGYVGRSQDRRRSPCDYQAAGSRWPGPLQNVPQGNVDPGLGVDLDEPAEILVFPAEPPHDLAGVVARADRPGRSGGASLLPGALAEVLDQVPVVAVEGGVRDAQCPLDRGHGGSAPVLGCLG